MKKINFCSALGFILAIFLFYACGSGGSNTSPTGGDGKSSGKDLAFGKLAEMVEEREIKIKEKEDQIKQNKDINKAYKLSKELEELQENGWASIMSYIANSNTPITIPVVQEGNADWYTITRLSLKEASGSGKFARLHLQSDIQLLKDEPSGMIYLQLASDDPRANDWLLLNQPTNIPGYPAAGVTYSYTGPLVPSKIIGVTKLIAKTKEDYKASKKLAR